MEKKILNVCIVLIIGLMVLSGCASHTALTKENRATLKAVSVNKDVSKPDLIGVHGMKETNIEFAGFLTGGIVGTAAASEIPKKRGPLLKYVMEKSGIDISEIVREKFIAQLKNSGFPCSITEEGGDAEFKLSIFGVGFSKPPGFTDNLRPWLYVDAILVKPDGAILWKDREIVQNPSQTPSRNFNEYINNPELIREALSIVSQIVSEKLVKDLACK